jgi:hypothetical protein
MAVKTEFAGIDWSAGLPLQAAEEGSFYYVEC